MPEAKYSKKRAVFDVILSLCTAGWWSIWMAYSRRKNV